MQIDHLRKESQTLLQQQEIKWSDLMQENVMFKERYKEMEKLYKEEIAERDVKIKQILKERFVSLNGFLAGKPNRLKTMFSLCKNQKDSYSKNRFFRTHLRVN